MKKIFFVCKVIILATLLILTNAQSKTSLPDSIIFNMSKIDTGIPFRTATATGFGHFTNYSFFKDSANTEHIAYVDNYELYYFKSTNNGEYWTKEKIITGHEGDLHSCALTVDHDGKIFIGFTIHSLYNYANPSGITGGQNYFLFDLYCVNNKSGAWVTELVSLHSASNFGPKVMGLYVDTNNNVHLIANYYGWMSYGGTAWEWIRNSTSNTWGTTQKIVEFLNMPVDRLIYDTYAIVPDQSGNVTIVMSRNISSTNTPIPRLFYVRHNGTSWAAPVNITDKIAIAWNRFDALVDPSGHTYIAYLESNTQGMPELKVMKDFQPAQTVQLNVASNDTLYYFRLHCNADGLFTMYLSIKNKTNSVLFSNNMINWSDPILFNTEESKYSGGVIVKTDTRKGFFTDYCKQINALAGQRASQPYGPDTLIYGDIRIDPSTFVEPNDNIPLEFKLSQNYPNPFNPTTNINFSLPERSFVELKIYNILGIEISTIVNKELQAGNYNFPFDAENLTSGIYFYKLNAGKFSVTKKMTLIK